MPGLRRDSTCPPRFEHRDATWTRHRFTRDGARGRRQLSVGGRQMANQRCRVLLADNHSMYRQGLRALLSQLPDLAVIGEVGDGAQAVERAVLLQPDVVLLAAWLPGQSV